jgi:hypothetical protein
MSLAHSPAQQHEHAACYTISEFCQSHRISRSKLYQLWQMGLGLRVKQIGTKKLINETAANAERSVRP